MNSDKKETSASPHSSQAPSNVSAVQDDVEGSAFESEVEVKDRISAKLEGSREAAAKAAENAKDKASQWGQDAKSAMSDGVRDISSNARELARSTVADQSRRLGEKADEYARAARAAVGRLREEDDDVIAEKVDRIAGVLTDSARYLKQSDPSEMRRDAEQMVRKNPEVAIGALLLAGVAIGRFLKASPRRERPTPRPASVQNRESVCVPSDPSKSGPISEPSKQPFQHQANS